MRTKRLQASRDTDINMTEIDPRLAWAFDFRPTPSEFLVQNQRVEPFQSVKIFCRAHHKSQTLHILYANLDKSFMLKYRCPYGMRVSSIRRYSVACSSCSTSTRAKVILRWEGLHRIFPIKTGPALRSDINLSLHSEIK